MMPGSRNSLNRSAPGHGRSRPRSELRASAGIQNVVIITWVPARVGFCGSVGTRVEERKEFIRYLRIVVLKRIIVY